MKIGAFDDDFLTRKSAFAGNRTKNPELANEAGVARAPQWIVFPILYL